MTIVFSDTHLTPEFDPKLFKRLKALIRSADRIIINGDFWDGYLTTFDEFVKSKWQKLFKLLKQKETIYLFGNHDQEYFGDHRYNLFSKQQANFFRFTQGKKKYHVEHGDNLTFNLTSHFSFLTPLMRRAYIFIEHQKSKRTMLGKLFGLVAAFQDKQGHQTIELFMQNQRKKNRYFHIFGHTHVPFFSEKLRYANPGRINQSEFGYIEITEKGRALKHSV